MTKFQEPRALYDEIAKHADFFSWETNDLTRWRYLSRDDSPRINQYMETGIFADDPSSVLDEAGVWCLDEISY